MLGVTYRAVSKWETGEAYPETSQLAPLADIFGVTVDELLRGEKNASSALGQEGGGMEKAKTLKPMNKKETVGIAAAVGVILLAALFLVTCAINGVNYGIYLPVTITFVAAAVFILVYTSMLREIRSAELNKAASQKGKKLALVLSLGIVAIILTVIPLVVMTACHISYKIYLPVFLATLIIAVPIIIMSGTMWGNFQKEYSLPQDEEAVSKNVKNLEDVVTSVIMLSATALFLLLGFLKGLWHPSWVVFPIGGIACGISSVIIRGLRNKE